MSSGSSSTWEELRREARKLEAELDVKVAAYAKLCSGGGASELDTRRLLNDSSSSSSGGGSGNISSSNSGASKSINSSNSHFDTVTAMSREIEQLIGHLSNVNNAMEKIITTSGLADNSRTHTLARHKDILNDFSQEFRRLHATNMHLQNRSALFDEPSGKTKGDNDSDHLALNIGGTSNYR